MPTGPTGAPRTLPAGFAWFGALPEREVERVVFSFVDFDAGAGKEIIEISVGEFPVVLEFPNAKVDILVLSSWSRLRFVVSAPGWP